MSYVLGYLFADGSVDVNPRGGNYFSFHMTDCSLLVAMRAALGSGHMIALRKGVGNEKDRHRMQVGSKYMCEKLRELGMTEQKSHTMRVPPVPEKYFGHFVRGYFDGDGNVWIGEVHKDRKTRTTVLQSTFTSCSESFLRSLRNRLESRGLGCGCLIFSRGAYRLQYSINDSILLYRLMYQDGCGRLVLPVKRKRFERYIKMRM